MAKYMKLLMVALFATMTFTFTSCSDDDDPDFGNTVGTWECVETFADNVDWDDIWGDLGIDDPLANYEQYIRFYADGTFVEVDIDNDGAEVTKGTWSQSGDKITIKGSDMLSGVATVVELTSSKLVVEMMGFPMTYKRVSDSEIDKYL